MILPFVIEEKTVSLLSSEGPGPLGNPVCGIFVLLFSTMTWRLISVFFRNFSNVIPFYRRQCIPVSNYVNDVDHHTVFVLNQFKMKSFPVL